MEVRTPRSGMASTASSDPTRGAVASSGPATMSSVPGRPGAIIASMSVPDAITNGLPDPARTSPIAWTAFRSAAPAAAKSPKSCLNARWMTPSASAAPARRLSMSSREPRRTRAPAAVRASAEASDLARPVTSWPAAMSSGTTADPTQPDAPVTKTCMR